MFQTLKNAWKITELRKKILYTLFMLLIYRVLCFIPTPGVDTAVIQDAIKRFSLLGFINQMTGADLANYSIMAMGITPYINASIIMQLLTVAIPKLEELNKQGEEGRKKIAQITRYVTVGLGFVQGRGAHRGSWRIHAGPAGPDHHRLLPCRRHGAGHVDRRAHHRKRHRQRHKPADLRRHHLQLCRHHPRLHLHAVCRYFPVPAGNFLGIIIVFLILIVGVTFIDLGERRVPVQYAKRVVGRKMYGGQSTHIPLKINASGVLPLIFASAIMQFPATIFAFFPNSQVSLWWNDNVHAMSWVYQLIFALLIIAFTFFYSSISFNPVEIAKNLQQNGGMIPGIRQGKPTSDFILKISRRITLFGALFLALLAVLPTVIYAIAGISLPFAASSLLIAVSVAMETMRQLESQMTMRHYKGFLN